MAVLSARHASFFRECFADIRETFPAIPWRQVIATRNRLIHGYLGIDNDTLWSIIQDDIPALMIQLQAMIK